MGACICSRINASVSKGRGKELYPKMGPPDIVLFLPLPRNWDGVQHLICGILPNNSHVSGSFFLTLTSFLKGFHVHRPNGIRSRGIRSDGSSNNRAM